MKDLLEELKQEREAVRAGLLICEDVNSRTILCSNHAILNSIIKRMETELNK